MKPLKEILKMISLFHWAIWMERKERKQVEKEINEKGLAQYIKEAKRIRLDREID